MRKIFETVAEAAKTAALDGTLNAADLRNNKKKVAVSLAKAALWTFIENHPAYIILKWVARAIIALIVLGIAIGLYFWF